MDAIELPPGHPLDLLAPMLADPTCKMEFSRYAYEPDSPKDVRVVSHVQCGPGGMRAALGLWRALGPGEELAAHSVVAKGGRSYHIPMVDFACPRLGGEELGRLAKFVPPEMLDSLAYFRTGRSFHGWSPCLVGHAELVRFWGACLLANPPGGPAVVDARWIGHRMLAGYGALRLSANTARSLAMPARVWPRGEGVEARPAP